MLTPMDVRQLTRWLRHLRLITPDRPITYPEGDQIELELVKELTDFSIRIGQRHVAREINHIWASCNPGQWEELMYLAERGQVPWPEIYYTDQVERLLDALAQEYPDKPDESDVAL